MTEQNSALSQEEMDFKAWHKAAWEEVEQFYEMVKTDRGFFWGERPPTSTRRRNFPDVSGEETFRDSHKGFGQCFHHVGKSEGRQ